MRQRIKGSKKSNKTNKNKQSTWFSRVRSNSPLQNIFGVVLPVFLFIGVGFYFIPQVSMQFQNNNVSAVNTENKTVLFYKSGCSHCQKIYPSVFWYNVRHFNEPSKQVQTINVQNPNNQHYINDYQLVSVPTFMTTTDTNSRMVSDDKVAVQNYLERR